MYNPEKRYEEKQRREQGYENRVRNNQSVHVGQGLKTDISNVNSEKHRKIITLINKVLRIKQKKMEIRRKQRRKEHMIM